MIQLRSSRRSVDFVKDGVGIEVSFYQSRTIQGDIFTKYPLIIRIQRLQIIVIIVPMKAIHKSFSEGFRGTYFEELKNHLTDLDFFLLKYPFAIIGISDNPSEIEVDELTTEMDIFLIDTVGFSLNNMRSSTEKERYDFKEMLLENRKIFHLACAMANQQEGGVVLFGVDDQGDIKGILRNDLDSFKNAIKNTISHNCRPCPAFTFLDFDDPSDSNKCVLVVHIQELEQKPCMADGNVYIRVGSESRAAKSEEIRRLILR